MEIGVIGRGKMGKDIVNYLFQFDKHQVVWICRKADDLPEMTAALEKQLGKMVKRGYLDESGYEKRRQAFRVAADLSALKDCDLVLESVCEEIEIKQELFHKLETIVSPECLLASNTSSLPLQTVFAKCHNQLRCLGLHFFFPVKIIAVVELNQLECTAPNCVKQARAFINGIEKRVLELEEAANMTLTRMINVLTTHLYNVYEERYLPVLEFDRVLKENLLTFGLFEILDSTGLNICIKSIENFNTERYCQLFAPLYQKMQQLLASGYQGGSGNQGLIAYETEHPPVLKLLDAAKLTEYKQDLVLDLQCLLFYELALVLKNRQVAKEELGVAVQEVFGLAENPFVMARRLGCQTIAERLTACVQRFQNYVYQPSDLAVLE